MIEISQGTLEMKWEMLRKNLNLVHETTKFNKILYIRLLLDFFGKLVTSSIIIILLNK